MSCKFKRKLLLLESRTVRMGMGHRSGAQRIRWGLVGLVLAALSSQPSGGRLFPSNTKQQASHHRMQPPVAGQYQLRLEQEEQHHKQQQQQQQQQVVANSPTNGTAILEDLINQIIERGRLEAAAQEESRQAQHQSQSTGDQMAALVQLETANENSLDPSASSLPAGADHQLNPLLELTTAPINVDIDSVKPTPADLLVDKSQQWDLEDRHIQYDVMQEAQATDWMGAKQAAKEQGTGQTAVERISNYKLAEQQPPINAQNQTNFTLGVIRIPEASQEPPPGGANNSSLDQILSTTGGRSGQVQARSMSGTTSRLPHHSRPPYASYNQFSQRPEVPSNATKEAESPSKQQVAGTERVGLAQMGEPVSRTSNESDGGQTSASSTTLSSSIQKISSHLIGAEQEVGNNKSPSASEQDELERTVQQLAPANKLVELSPIPAGSSHLPAGNASRETLTERGYFVAEEQHPTSAQTYNLTRSPERAPNDRYSSNTFDLFDSSGYPHSAGSGPAQLEPLNALPSNLHLSLGAPSSKDLQQKPHDSRSGSPDSSNQQVTPVALKTLESVSNQILQQQRPLSQHHDRLGSIVERSPSSSGGQQRAGFGQSQGHFAASLINITAPMVLPLSATEAMEASVGSEQGPLNQLGGQRVLPSVAQPHRTGSSFFVAPASGGGLGAQSIYSQPANSFSPRPSTELAPPVDSSLTTPPTSIVGAAERERMRVQTGGAGHHRPRGPHHQLHQASGFRSPLQQHLPQLSAAAIGLSSFWPSSTAMPIPSSYLMSAAGELAAPLAQSEGPRQAVSATVGQEATTSTPSTSVSPSQAPSKAQERNSTTTTNGFITSSISNATGLELTTSTLGAPLAAGSPAPAATAAPVAGRLFNLTRVEHISAECSNDLIRTVIIFNGTFKGIIYSSGYVRDQNCLYINGTGKTRYDFSIKLNQCGTLGRQETHPPSGPNEVRRRDQVMWNTLSIQYNPIIEQEWDEHFRVSCEYGSDFWKTVSFSPFNVETNTGSPVVFTVDPPQCQMEILRGHGMVGPRQEAVSGPVTVGDPLTLLIHMKSEKAGYDILIKNCIAHNGGQQKMQLIDSNGCVVNERFISPFRGTYSDNDLKHVTLFSYLKAFRFTGSPVLYLECEVHMCQSSCPPQMCYWRRLSKRSVDSNDTQGTNYEDDTGDDSFYSLQSSPTELVTTQLDLSTTTTAQAPTITRESKRAGHKMGLPGRPGSQAASSARPKQENLSDKISLFQALEVRQERQEPDTESAPLSMGSDPEVFPMAGSAYGSRICYRRSEVFAFLFTTVSILLAAISITIGCCLRASNLRRQSRKRLLSALSLSSANLCHCPLSATSGSDLPPAGSQCSAKSSRPPTASSFPIEMMLSKHELGLGKLCKQQTAASRT